jgi:predicted nucleic acid-binding protein
LSYNVIQLTMVIFDASTLILLAKINMLDLFISHVQDSVCIPQKVRSEVTAEKREETRFIIRCIEDGKITVAKIRNTALAQKFSDDFNIDAGEAEALALAIEKKASIVATDDRNAIRACKILKLDFITAVAVLIRAVEKGLIEKDEGLVKLQKLRSVGRYSKTIIEDAARQIQGGR